VADAAGLARSCKTSCPRLIVVRGGVLAHIIPEHTRNHVGTDLTGSEKHLDKIVGRRVAAHKGHRFARGECDADYELDERVEGLSHEWERWAAAGAVVSYAARKLCSAWRVHSPSVFVAFPPALTSTAPWGFCFGGRSV
jgi:hypothetical protein